MKKIMMVAVMAVAALAANAQTWVGGTIGLNTEKTKFESTDLSSGTSFQIAPEIGYNLNEKFAVAVAVSYGHYANKTISLAGQNVNGTVNAFSIEPYLRYTFVKAGNLSVFCDGVLDYSTMHMRGVDNNLNGVGIAITPGISFAVSPKVSLVAHIGEMSYAHTWFDINNGTITNNTFKVGLTNSISFGAYVNI